MTIPDRYARGLRAAGLLGVLVLCCSPAVGQEITLADARITATGQYQISILFSRSYTVDERVTDPDNYVVTDIVSGRRLAVINVEQGLSSTVLVLLDPTIRLRSDGIYHLYVRNLRFAGEDPEDPLQRLIDVSSMSTGGPDAKEDNAQRGVTAADGRADADVYASGEVTKTSPGDFAGTVDLKVQYPRRKVWRGRMHRLSPLFELKASSQPEGDADSMLLGFDWEWAPWRYQGASLRRPFRRLMWGNSGKVEAERDFDNANLVWDTRFTLLSKTWISDRATFYVRPFAGAELGVNLKSPLADAEGAFLARFTGGTTIDLIFPVGQPGLDSVGFNVSYIGRWLTRDELSFEVGPVSELLLVTVGKSPRHYVDAKLTFDFSDLFGSAIGYEYGSLPPSFKLVDSKFVATLVYKFKFKS